MQRPGLPFLPSNDLRDEEIPALNAARGPKGLCAMAWARSPRQQSSQHSRGSFLWNDQQGGSRFAKPDLRYGSPAQYLERTAAAEEAYAYAEPPRPSRAFLHEGPYLLPSPDKVIRPPNAPPPGGYHFASAEGEYVHTRQDREPFTGGGRGCGGGSGHYSTFGHRQQDQQQEQQYEAYHHYHLQPPSWCRAAAQRQQPALPPLLRPELNRNGSNGSGGGGSCVPYWPAPATVHRRQDCDAEPCGWDSAAQLPLGALSRTAPLSSPPLPRARLPYVPLAQPQPSPPGHQVEYPAHAAAGAAAAAAGYDYVSGGKRPRSAASGGYNLPPSTTLATVQMPKAYDTDAGVTTGESECDSELFEDEIIDVRTVGSGSGSGGLPDMSGMPRKRERWSRAEHEAFLRGVTRYGRAWKKVQNMVPTRTLTQVRTHAYGFFHKLVKMKLCRPNDDPVVVIIATEAARRQKRAAAVAAAANEAVAKVAAAAAALPRRLADAAAVATVPPSPEDKAATPLDATGEGTAGKGKGGDSELVQLALFMASMKSVPATTLDDVQVAGDGGGAGVCEEGQSAAAKRRRMEWNCRADEEEEENGEEKGGLAEAAAVRTFGGSC